MPISIVGEASRACPLGTDHEAPAYSQWVLPCPLHCPRGSSYMPLALYTKRPRSASGPRPSRSLMLFGIVCEASHAGQLHSELISAMTTWCCQLFDHSIGAVKIVSERATNVSSTRSKTVCCSHSQKIYSVGVSAHNPGTSAGVAAHTRRPQIKQGAHRPIDHGSEENVFHFKWFLSTV